MIPWMDTRANFVANTPRNGTLLDLGSSDGETLGHIHELREDISLFAADIQGTPEKHPLGTTFHRLDLATDDLPWEDGFFDAITCMHLVEHLPDIGNLLKNIARTLKPGGATYIETPHPKTACYPKSERNAGSQFTMNFYDDPTHIAPVPVAEVADTAQRHDLQARRSGTLRNILFVCAFPISFLFRDARKRFTAKAHWLGWSSYVILEK